MKSNYIYNKIRKSSLYSSLLVLSVLVAIFIISNIIPFSDIFSPVKMSVANSAATVYNSGVEYVDLTVNEIYYTGYDSYRGGHKTGSYYYSLVNNSCTLLLIDDKSNKPKHKLTNYHIEARLVKNSKLSENVIKKLAKDLNWTTDGISRIISEITIDETSYNYTIYIYIALSLVLIFIIFLSLLIKNIIFIIFPRLHPAATGFNKLGGSLKELDNVDYEINNNIILKSKNLILTKNYILSSSLINLEIIPICSIIWAYENTHNYISLNKKKYNFKHTINFLCKHKIYLSLPKDSDDNINTILDYLKTNYTNIIIGYSKENREIALKKCVVKKHSSK